MAALTISSNVPISVVGSYEILKLEGSGANYAHSGAGDFFEVGAKFHLLDDKLGISLTAPLGPVVGGPMGGIHLRYDDETLDEKKIISELNPAFTYGLHLNFDYKFADLFSAGLGVLYLSQSVETAADRMTEVATGKTDKTGNVVNSAYVDELGHLDTDSKDVPKNPYPDGTRGLYDPTKETAYHYTGDEDMSILAGLGQLGVNFINEGGFTAGAHLNLGVGHLSTPNFSHLLLIYGVGAGAAYHF